MGKWSRIIPLLLLLVVVPVLAQTPDEQDIPSPVLLVEIQTGSATNPNDEFIEIYNQSDEPYPADELKLQYRSATGDDWLNKAGLSGVLEPRGRYLIASSGLNIEANVISSLGLAAGGGHLRIVELASDGEISLDRVAWGTAQFSLVAPALSPAPGQSLKRTINEDGHFVDSGDDSLDFIVSTTPSPEFSPIREDDEPDPDPNTSSGTTGPSSDETSQTNSKPNSQRNYSRLEISELLADPDKPLTDAEDEFVELFNPNAEAIDLEGYIIQTGSKYSYNFTIPNITIKPKQYLAFYSLDTGLALSNSGGGARLLAPDKSPIYEAPTYEKAKPDIAWANVNGVWQWTAKPTPNAPNTAAATNTAGRSSGTNNGRTYLSQGKTLAAEDDGRGIYEEPPNTADNQIDTAVVAGVGAMALLYAGNEYRYDVANFFQKLKRHFTSRRGGGAAA